MEKRIPLLITIIMLILALTACSDSATASSKEDSVTTANNRPEGWGEETHSNDAEPNYEVVFPGDQVNQMKITIATEDWEAMQANMTELFGEAGTGAGNRGRQPLREDRPQPEESTRPNRPENGQQPELPDRAPGGGRPGNGGFGAGDMTPENPMWISATIEFDGHTWTDVGVRYKGNSSLTNGWRSGSLSNWISMNSKIRILKSRINASMVSNNFLWLTVSRMHRFYEMQLPPSFWKKPAYQLRKLLSMK